MPWIVRLKTGAANAINKLDKPVRDRIKTFLDQLTSKIIRALPAKPCKANCPPTGAIGSATIV